MSEHSVSEVRVFVCPKCDGAKADLAQPSPGFREGEDEGGSYPPCGLCKGRGFVVYDLGEELPGYFLMSEVD